MRDLFETTIERIFSDLVSPALIHQCAAGAWPSELWSTLDEAEMTCAAVPEALGGSGATWEDTFTLVRAAGAHAVPAPFADTLLANWLLGRAGLHPTRGPLAIAAHSQLTCVDGQASGRLEKVPWGRDLKRIIAFVTDPARLIVLDTGSAAQLERRSNLAGEPRDTVMFDHARPIHIAALPSGVPTDFLQLCGAMLRSAQMAGALQSLLQMTVGYATERVQFGQPIGHFQVIQQQIAVMAEHAACGLLAAEVAFAESADDNIAALPIMAAKICAGEAASIGASTAHAVHGAIGFTDEHSLHLKTRRLWAWRAEYGSQAYWSQRLGYSVCYSGSRALWPMLTQTAIPTTRVTEIPS